ncbi:MAG: hypothetical protein JW750_04185 [Anaerolineaceae bacterium]|nr:hypothetical protein [Anaerolineaceae bacterium]
MDFEEGLTHMQQGKDPEKSRFLLNLFIIVRVAVILVIWLGLFLAMFLGYFTIPILLIGIFTLTYAISHLRPMIYDKTEDAMLHQREAFLEESENIQTVPEEIHPDSTADSVESDTEELE